MMLIASLRVILKSLTTLLSFLGPTPTVVISSIYIDKYVRKICFMIDKLNKLFIDGMIAIDDIL